MKINHDSVYEYLKWLYNSKQERLNGEARTNYKKDK